jgi:sugar phosphate isomerase/epimerase
LTGQTGIKDKPLLQLKLSINTACLRQPLITAFTIAADLGAEAVEIDARQELPSEISRTAVRHIQKYLSDYRLKIACLTFQTRHSLVELKNLEQRLDAIKNTLRTAYELGTNAVVCDIGRIPEPTQEKERVRLRDILNEIGRFSHKEGAFLAARTGQATADELADMITELEPGSIMIDLDPGNIILHEHEVKPALERLTADTLHLHARDAVRDFAIRKGVEVELGRGSVDWPEVLARLEQFNFSGYATVGRSDSPNPVLECQQAAEYLKNLFT